MHLKSTYFLPCHLNICVDLPNAITKLIYVSIKKSDYNRITCHNMTLVTVVGQIYQQRKYI